MRMNPSRWSTEMREVNAFTPEEDARLKREVMEWIEYGRSVEKLDRARAAEAIRALYAAIGSPTPAVVFFSSPAMCISAWQALQAAAWQGTKRASPHARQREQELRSEVQAQLRAQPISQAWSGRCRQADSSVRRQIESRSRSRAWCDAWDELSRHFDARIDKRLDPRARGQLEIDLRETLWTRLRSCLWWLVELELEDQFTQAVRPPPAKSSVPSDNEREDSADDRERVLYAIKREESMLEDMQIGIHMPALERIPAHLGKAIWEHSGACLGTWWCASAVFYDFCGRLGLPYALEEKRILRLWVDQCRHAHWWFECDGIVFVSERPSVLTVDAQGRLHNEQGPALDYGDGFRVCAIHGVRVEAEAVLHPEHITLRRIETESNIEVRRVLTMLYGPARYLKDSGATLEHQDERGKLWRKKRTEDADLVMVEVVNSTPEPDGSLRSYLLRVPPGMRTASEAVAWTFGMQSRHYRPSVET